MESLAFLSSLSFHLIGLAFLKETAGSSSPIGSCYPSAWTVWPRHSESARGQNTDGPNQQVQARPFPMPTSAGSVD